MAERPVFVPGWTPRPTVHAVPIQFKWSGGFALSQSRKNIRALEGGAAELGVGPVLEVSSKSEAPLGGQLSAFNLTVQVPGTGTVVLEAAFQGSKVFEGGGPFHDLYGATGREAKKDPRIRGSGGLVGFDFGGERWPLEPLTAFYDWLYLNALSERPDLYEDVLDFGAFSDIAFNPSKSINCQARSVALFVALHTGGQLAPALESPSAFRRVHRETVRYEGLRPLPPSQGTDQLGLFG